MDNQYFDDTSTGECIIEATPEEELEMERLVKDVDIDDTDHEYHELLDPRYADEDNTLPEMPYYPMEINPNPQPFEDSDNLDNLVWDESLGDSCFRDDALEDNYNGI